MVVVRIDKRVCVVEKPVSAERGGFDAVGGSLAARVASRRRLAQSEHAASIAAARAIFADVEATAITFTDDADRDADAIAEAELVVTIGGDGTFLAGARHTRAGALLGCNSSPSTSVGHYCATAVDGLRDALADVAAGRMQADPMTRLAVTVDGAPLPYLALNDALVAHRSPVQATTYAITVGDRTELQLSSGLWIATASGSTAAIRSAGGDVMAADDRRLQFLVRESYAPRSGAPTLLRGYTDDAIALVSRSDRNAIFLDGHPHPWPFGRGARAEIRVADACLLVYGYALRARRLAAEETPPAESV